MIIDTNSSCVGKTGFLKERGVDAVGRYYRVIHPEWAITKKEAQELSKAGIKIFVVYEDVGSPTLTKAQGKKDGATAIKQAKNIGQPEGGVIYFATEGLPGGYTTADLPRLRDYFSGVTEAVAGQYTLGVYGDGIVCKTLLDEKICTHTWLAQASYKFEGSQEFYASRRWNLAQIVLDLPKKPWKGLSVDINEAKDDFGGFLVPTAVA
jgi:hypothetical protein